MICPHQLNLCFDLQMFCRSLQSHKSKVEMMRQYAIQSGEGLDIEVTGPKYNETLKISDSMYEVCEETADWLKSVLILWQSFEESSVKFNSWTDNVVQKSVYPCSGNARTSYRRCFDEADEIS